MNFRKLLTLATLLATLAASSALAAPVGTAKARGDYRPFWQSNWNQPAVRHHAYARRSYAPMVVASAPAPVAIAAPAATTTSAPQVAQAPDAGRRFSYEPQTAAPQQATAAPAIAPAPQAAPATTMAAPQRMMAAPRHYSRRATRHTPNRWALPKTDPRKYTTG
jgi:hypothetical protein